MTETNLHTIPADAPLSTALAMLNNLSGGAMTLFVHDSAGRITGSVTDGDVRRALLAGVSVNDSVSSAMNHDFRFIDGDKDSADAVVEKLRDMRRCGITLVPVLDSNGKLVEIIDLHKTSNRLPLNAVLMAGGKGERLRPMTLTTPKPLLQIEGRAIIDYNIHAMAAAGITNVSVITRYLADQLYEHFCRPVAGINVRCLTESLVLGTIGGAALALSPSSPNRNTLIMNSDLLTTVSFEDMYLRHIAEKADVTVAVINYTLSVPYAILSTDSNDCVTSIEEKPTYTYYANAGIYIFKNEILESMAQDTRTDATDLIEDVIRRGGKVVCHPVNGTWIDIGSPADFQRATEMMRHHRNLSRR